MKILRRDFLMYMGAGLSSAAWGAAFPTGGRRANHLLLETRAFASYGGWVLDPQFEDIMGYPYLLAHGLGRPVANAKTKAVFPSVGTYHVWVRTRNWCPGAWEAPGRFKVLVNGRPLSVVFGTEPGWAWQRGGTVEIARPQASIELEDMTGLEGRCDALFFTQDAMFVPPEEMTAMRMWRQQVCGRPVVPAKHQQVDVVVAGGGLAGCAAAMAASRAGLTVALIHDRPVLGGNASGEIRVHALGIAGQSGDLIASIDTQHWPNGSADALVDDRKRHAAMNAARGVKQFLEWRLCDVQMDGARIKSVDARHIRTGESIRFNAPVFIDCTGDAWLGFRAGAEFRYGRESKHEFNEGWDEHNELWSPEKADAWTMGASLLWGSREAKLPVAFPSVPWASPVARDYAAIAGEWQWEFARPDWDQMVRGEEIRDHLFRAIYGSFANAKRDPKNERRVLEWMGYLLGRRESRRLMGDHLYTLQDIKQNKKFADTVAEEIREVDVHYQRVLAGYPVDFISKALFMKVGRYYIPFRSLYSRNISNLMMAGRCFSCTHVALGGPRVQRTTAQMGVATGYAAALCKKYNVSPREVGQKHVVELRHMIGYTEET